jgi:IS30 family transposase
VQKQLKKLWSPQRIAWRWSKDNPLRRVSHVTVYKYIYSTFGSGLGYDLYTKRHKPKKRKKKKTGNHASHIEYQ